MLNKAIHLIRILAEFFAQELDDDLVVEFSSFRKILLLILPALISERIS